VDQYFVKTVNLSLLDASSFIFQGSLVAIQCQKSYLNLQFYKGSALRQFLLDLMFQPQRTAVDTHGIKPLPKMDENRAIKKPDSATGRPARAAYEPIELPSSFPSGLFKVSSSDPSSLLCGLVYFGFSCLS